MPTWRGTARRLRGVPRSVPSASGWRGLSRQSAQNILDIVYELILARGPDATGTASYLEGLRNGTLTPQDLAAAAIASGEWWTVSPFPGLARSLHFSRMMFVRSLPPARRILDLGGTSLGNPIGALVLMGYPYVFDDLVVVDLPSEERDALYREADAPEVTQTPLGPVRYRYHSMVDLSDYPDNSVDLVYSGQSIEHVTTQAAESVLSEVGRVLRPGGYLGLDTPNARVTRLQQDEFIDPDHEYEYTDAELRTKLGAAGFDVVGAWGLNHAGPSLAAGRFDADETAKARGLFHQIEDCYLLAYLCQVPG
jgi:SAM-dependent methyltransferase